jgi:glycosyltransferase involved in cell wall biosynthesis
MSSVAVVVPTYNGSLTLPELLAALSEQTDAPAFEVLLADNGSTDDTRVSQRDFRIA